ncbi:unnamed protein product [Darwinula stevensoni]|uniref:Trehalose-6-phosphate synthase n=1 Tax=Darwinula stevensoni TaxID=69355 RepID=A0A7R8XK73_9CRUS|nr:unnamed protein product [Darwinula stevensoni]CAG0895472.1 unnamed protein product [Darwinula stevensoni]
MAAHRKLKKILLVVFGSFFFLFLLTWPDLPVPFVAPVFEVARPFRELQVEEVDAESLEPARPSTRSSPAKRIFQAEDIDPRTKERRERIAETCRRYDPGKHKRRPGPTDPTRDAPFPSFSVFFFYPKMPLAYCPIYKAASTSWLWFMRRLAGVSDATLLSGQMFEVARTTFPHITVPGEAQTGALGETFASLRPRFDLFPPRKAEMKSPIVVVSNRLPFILCKDDDGELQRKPCAGGLVTAVAPVVIQCGGLWVGWPGIHMDDPHQSVPESDPGDKGPSAGLKSEQVVVVHVEEQIFDDYYNGCCNATFWPLFHSMPDRAVFVADMWEAYSTVNAMFAYKTVEALKKLKAQEEEGEERIPLVWIHDYHLMLAANHIRQQCEEENLKCNLGFFLHIPFPPWDIFRLFPWDDDVLQGILGCDMVGFHIEDYCRNFLDCCQRRLGFRVDRVHNLVDVAGRTVKVRALPIGIPYKRFEEMANAAPRALQSSQQIILGVDRLDYTKGLVNRIRSFERLLEKHPEHLEVVKLMQVAVPSRTDVKEYQQLKEQIDLEVGRINGRFSTANWSPIRYIFGCISQDELAAYYRDSSVALVTPLRDGMNLVAKEYVACQVDKPGVLILSLFAGAGETMHEALLVNPYELDGVADTLHRALTMPDDEREMRMYHLKKRERTMDVDFWLSSFLKAMGSLDFGEEQDEPMVTKSLGPMTMEDFDEFLSDYIGDTAKIALLLDYDGTLAPIAPKPDIAFMPAETKNILVRLSNSSDIAIAIVSGRSLEDVRKMVGIDGITYAGNHGLEILHPDGSKFVHPVPEVYHEKMRNMCQELQDECCREGAWVENKGNILTYHLRAVPIQLRSTFKQRATAIIIKNGFKCYPALCAIEARPPVHWNKEGIDQISKDFPDRVLPKELM